MIRICTICNKEFKKPLCRILIGRGKYCSKICYYKFRKGKRISISSEFKKGHLLGKRIQKGQHLSPSTEFKLIKGKPNCKECGRKLHSYKAIYCKYHSKSKERSNFWNGGVADKNRGFRLNIMRTPEYQEWRKAVFSRDNYICVLCKSLGPINADHIIKFADIIKAFKITTIEEAIACKPLWDINNGRTLCVPCHRKTDTWGNRIKSLLTN